MIAISNEQTRKDLELDLKGNSMTYQGGIPILTGEMGRELCIDYLNEVGRIPFLRKLKTQEFTARDHTRVMIFLMLHNIQPSIENCYKLVTAAGLELLFTEGV